MSIASRKAAGWVERAAFYADRGWSIQTLYDAWGGYASGEDSRTLNAIWNAGLAASEAGRRALTIDAGGNVPLGYIPQERPGAQTFRYTVVVTYTNTATGAVQPVTDVIDSAFQLSADELEQRLGDTNPSAVSRSRGGHGYAGNDSDWDLTNFVITSIVRV